MVVAGSASHNESTCHGTDAFNAPLSRFIGALRNLILTFSHRNFNPTKVIMSSRRNACSSLILLRRQLRIYDRDERSCNHYDHCSVRFESSDSLARFWAGPIGVLPGSVWLYCLGMVLWSEV